MNLSPFLYNFKDPASVYAYSLMFVHHQVMWFMIIILAVVYWSFYRVIREYNWNSFNKQFGLLYTISYSSPLLYQIELLWTKAIVNLSQFWLKVMYKLSSYFIGSIKSEQEGLLYHQWARLAITIQLLFNYKNNSSIAVEELLTAKYFYYSSNSRATVAYVLSSAAHEQRDIIKVQSFRENLLLEYIWAIFPSIVIFLILVPSLYLLYSLEENMDPKLNIKVIGHQWFWSYEFDSLDLELSFEFDSNLIPESDLTMGAKRLLEVDNRLYLPINVPLRILITSSDVLHSWAVPELGIKVDAVPGRLNDCITLIRRPGVFYGQCSELCGVGHGFMPIVVEACSYKHWVEAIKQY